MKESAIEIAKSLPPVSVGTLTLMGVPLSEVTLILTAIYTSILIVVLVRDKITLPWLNKRKRE